MVIYIATSSINQSFNSSQWRTRRGRGEGSIRGVVERLITVLHGACHSFENALWNTRQFDISLYWFLIFTLYSCEIYFWKFEFIIIFKTTLLGGSENRWNPNFFPHPPPAPFRRPPLVWATAVLDPWRWALSKIKNFPFSFYNLHSMHLLSPQSGFRIPEALRLLMCIYFCEYFLLCILT